MQIDLHITRSSVPNRTHLGRLPNVIEDDGGLPSTRDDVQKHERRPL